MLKYRKTCRICNSPLVDILDLGEQYLAGYVSKNKSVKFSQRKVPLILCRCDTSDNDSACGLVQLRHTTPPFLLYQYYFYRSELNDNMCQHLFDLADHGTRIAEPKGRDIIVDIGANDGCILRYLSKHHYTNLVGFEPARNLTNFHKDLKGRIINDFFSADSYRELTGLRKAKLIFSIAMFYDIEDPNKFVADIYDILEDDGIWVLEQSYLPSMLLATAFDSIVHEHIAYYSLDVLEKLFEKHNMKIVDIETNSTNGGSVRIFVAKNRFHVTDEAAQRIYNLKLKEFETSLDTEQPFIEFEKRVANICSDLYDFISNEKKKGKVTFAYGASTKGSVTLQASRLDNELIPACADRNSDKWGLAMGGVNIPIVSEEEARKSNPDYLLILPWHFLDGFIKREREYLKNGGKFIVPMPNVKIISEKDL